MTKKLFKLILQAKNGAFSPILRRQNSHLALPNFEFGSLS